MADLCVGGLVIVTYPRRPLQDPLLQVLAILGFDGRRYSAALHCRMRNRMGGMLSKTQYEEKIFIFQIFVADSVQRLASKRYIINQIT
jgi:hypothetical protein